MPVAAFLFRITLASFVVASITVSYPHCISCRCGSSNQNYTQCIDKSLLENLTCERWSHCQTCKANTTSCITCQQHRFGPSCTKMKRRTYTCPDPGIPQVGNRLNTDGSDASYSRSFDERESVVYSCKIDSFILLGSSFITCLANGSWSANLPRCVRAYPVVRQRDTCPDPGIPQGGSRLNTDGSDASYPRSFEEGESVIFSCNGDGFALQGTSYITCLAAGTWSANSPRCIRSSTISTTTSKPSCEHPGTFENGFIQNIIPETQMQSYPQYSILIFHCNEGYELIGTPGVQCLRNAEQLGYWSEPPPFCRSILITTTPRPTKGVSCQNPGMVENGIFENYPSKTVSFPLGTALKFQCVEGYRMEGSGYIYCVLPGKWSGSLPNCRIIPTVPDSCTDPGPIEHGNQTVYPNMDHGGSLSSEGEMAIEYPVGSVIKYECGYPYRLDGEASLICISKGRWSASKPRCIEGLCSDPGSIQYGGVMVYESNPVAGRRPSNQLTSITKHPIGTRLKYSCSSGFRLEGEENLICISPGIWSAEKPRCIEDCGLSLMSAGGKITNGKNTQAGEFPWIVFLYINETQSYCGGVLKDRRTVISAAHCFENAGYCTLYFGKYNWSDAKDDQHVETRTSSEIIIHPDFDSNAFDNDIAIVKFSRDVPYTMRIQPICLPTPSSTATNVVPGELGYLTKWRLNKSQLSRKLRLANLPVQEPEICKSAYQRRGTPINFTPGQYCAGFENPPGRLLNVCRGDSGSPMVFYNNRTKRFTVEGLVSFELGGNCDLPERYTMFTEVNYYLPWILRNS